jgi:hypothetical protein
MDMPLSGMVNRLPVNTGRLHHRQIDLGVLEPYGKLQKLLVESAKSHGSFCCLPVVSFLDYGTGYGFFVHIQSRTGFDGNIPNFLKRRFEPSESGWHDNRPNSLLTLKPQNST